MEDRRIQSRNSSMPLVSRLDHLDFIVSLINFSALLNYNLKFGFQINFKYLGVNLDEVFGKKPKIRKIGQQEGIEEWCKTEAPMPANGFGDEGDLLQRVTVESSDSS